MKAVMDITDARNVIKDLKEKPFICSQYTIETESGYVITTKSKRPYCNPKKHTNADRIRSMSDEELAKENIYFVSALNAKEGLHYTGLDGHYYRTTEEVVEANMKWLQSEVEG